MGEALAEETEGEEGQKREREANFAIFFFLLQTLQFFSFPFSFFLFFPFLFLLFFNILFYNLFLHLFFIFWIENVSNLDRMC